MARRIELHTELPGGAGEIFTALVRTLSFRRWSRAAVRAGLMPGRGLRYRYQAGTVLRAGRVVEVMNPVVITMKEILRDTPCRVGLKMRWRIEPGVSVCVVRLSVRYRLNHAAIVRRAHWERRLSIHFHNQIRFLRSNLEELRRGAKAV